MSMKKIDVSPPAGPQPLCKSLLPLAVVLVAAALLYVGAGVLSGRLNLADDYGYIVQYGHYDRPKKAITQRQSAIRNERWSTRIKLTSLPRKPTTNLDRSKVLKCLLAITRDHIAKRPARVAFRSEHT